MCSGGPRKVTQPLAGVDTDPPSQPLALLSRCGLPPPRNSSFPAPSLSQLTQPELKEQMSVQSQNTGPASAKCGLTSTFLERSFLRSQTPRPSTEVLLTPQSRRRSWTSAEKGAHRPRVLLHLQMCNINGPNVLLDYKLMYIRYFHKLHSFRFSE